MDFPKEPGVVECSIICVESNQFVLPLFFGLESDSMDDIRVLCQERQRAASLA